MPWVVIEDFRQERAVIRWVPPAEMVRRRKKRRRPPIEQDVLAWHVQFKRRFPLAAANDPLIADRLRVAELRERAWLSLVEGNRAAARKKGRTTSAAADDRRQRIVDAAIRYRERHPYDPERRSTRRLARDIAVALDEAEGTTRRILRVAGIR